MKKVLLTFALGLLVNLNSFALDGSAVGGSDLDVASSAESKFKYEAGVANVQPLSTCVENPIEEFPVQPTSQGMSIQTCPLNRVIFSQIQGLKENVIVENSFLNLNKDIYCVISDFLDMKSICVLLRLNTKISPYSLPIIVRNMPKIYTERGMDFDTVLLKISHRDWTPWSLPEDVYLALHRAYIQALKLRIPSHKTNPEDWSVDEVANIHKRFKMLCSAGSLGHQLAMREAALMLRNRVYNDVVPLLLDLEPWAIQYDCRRLNRDLVENKALAEFIHKFQHMCDGVPKEQILETMQIRLPELLKDLITIENALIEEANINGRDAFEYTKEVKAIHILLTEMLALANKGDMQERPPEIFIKFVNDHHVNTPFVNSITIGPNGYGAGADVDDPSDFVSNLMISNFNHALNFMSVIEYAKIWCAETNTKTIVENGEVFPPLRRRNMPYASKIHDELISVAILLGAEEHAHYQCSGKSKYPAPIPTFMYHLMLTRLMSQQSCLSQARFNVLFENITNYLYGFLAMYGHAPQPEQDPDFLWNLKRYQNILTLGSNTQSNK